jgi:hypothetical protein
MIATLSDEVYQQGARLACCLAIAPGLTLPCGTTGKARHEYFRTSRLPKIHFFVITGR